MNNRPRTVTGDARLRQIWADMKKRCSRPRYENYYGRGISVCEEWMDFFVFRSWALSHGYSDDLTIDRIDNDGNYEPQNCRWATMREQSNNRRSNHILTYNGESATISEWARRTGINKRTIKNRLNWGWSVERALTEKIDMRRIRRDCRAPAKSQQTADMVG